MNAGNMRKIAEVTGNFPSLENGGPVPRLVLYLSANGDELYLRGNNTGDIGPFSTEKEVGEFVMEKIEMPDEYQMDGRSGLPAEMIQWLE